MTLDDAQMFSDHFKRHPPLRMLVMGCAMVLGVEFPKAKEPEAAKSKYMTERDFDALLAATGGKIPGLGPVGT